MREEGCRSVLGPMGGAELRVAERDARDVAERVVVRVVGSLCTFMHLWRSGAGFA